MRNTCVTHNEISMIVTHKHNMLCFVTHDVTYPKPLQGKPFSIMHNMLCINKIFFINSIYSK